MTTEITNGMTNEFVYILLGIIGCLITWAVTTLNGHAAMKRAQEQHAAAIVQKTEENASDRETRIKSTADLDAVKQMSKKDVEDLESKNRELTTELREEKEKVKELEDDLETKKTINQDLNLENKKIEVNIANLTQQAVTLNTDISKIKTENETQEKDNEKLKNDNDQLNLTNKMEGIEIANLTQETVKLKNDISELKAENEKLKEELSQARAQHLKDYKLNLELSAKLNSMEYDEAK